MWLSEILNEEIFGKFAVVYHRTHSHENIAAIRKDGFVAGPRAMYGSGIYATYSLTSQFSPYMVEQYGDFIIKSRLNLDRFLILDRAVAVQVYGPHNASLLQQVKNLFQEGPYSYKLEELQEKLDDGEPSSRVARQIVAHKHVMGMRGIVYTGQADGRCAVSYETDTILPMSWTTATMADVQAIRSNKMVGIAEREFASGLQWQKIVNRDLVAKAMKPNIARDMVSNPDLIKMIPNPTPEQQIAAVTASPMTIRFIKNPVPEAQVLATQGSTAAIEYIEHPVPAAIIWPLRVNLDNTKLLDRLPQATVLAALKLDCTILPAVMRHNPDRQATREQWLAAWQAPNTSELISIALTLNDHKKIDASAIPVPIMNKVMHDNPAKLYLFTNVAPQSVAAAITSPASQDYNLALGNCAMENILVDTSAVDPATLMAILKQHPHSIFALADPTVEQIATAMKASSETARDLGRRYHLPPELQALVPASLNLFNRGR